MAEKDRPNSRKKDLKTGVFLVILLCFSALNGLEARKVQPTGVLALSSGQHVVLANARDGRLKTIESGPVGFLFPAPGGVVFAPDLIHNRTSIIDLRLGRVKKILNFMDMPRFTVWKDRYIVLAGDLLMLSYPERSLIFRMKAEITSPWQIYSTEDGMSLLVLERAPDGGGPSALTALDLGVRKRVFRKSFSADMVRFAQMEDPGVLVLADRSGSQILVLDPTTLRPLRKFPMTEAPSDLISVGNVLYASGDGGKIRRWRLEARRDGDLKVDELDSIPTDGRVSRMAVSPDGLFFAAASARGKLQIFESRKARQVREIDIPRETRDLVWINPQEKGPILPLWSDQGHEMPEDLGQDASKE